MGQRDDRRLPAALVASLASLLMAMSAVAGCASDEVGGDVAAGSSTLVTAGSTTSEPATSTAESTGKIATSTEHAWDYTEPELEPVTTLIDPGAEPREVRVYQPAVGLSETANLVTTADIVQVLDGTQAALSSEVTIVNTNAVLDVTEEGIVISSTFDSVTATSDDQATQASLDAGFADLIGLTVYQLIAPSGALLATESFNQIPGGEIITGSLSGAVSPLPAEPFGVGAVWETVGSLESNGVVFVQTSTFTVTDIQGPLVSVEIALRQELGPDGFTLPGLDTADIDADVSTDGSGAAVWNLEGVFPVSADSSTTQTLDATISADGQTGRLEQVVDATFSLDRL